MQQRLAANTAFTRRDILKWLAGAGAWLAGGHLPATQRLETIKRAIPRTGEELPVIGLGTARTFDIPSAGDIPAALREVMHQFLLRGGRVIDSSPMYGTAEAVVGNLLQETDKDGRPFLATKVWTSGREAGIRQMRQSMRRLGTERIDLMQVHNLIDTETHLDTLEEWRQQQRVRYIGVTHYLVDAYDELMRIIDARNIDFVQFNYNIVTREAERRLLPLCAERGVAVLINEPFENASLFSLVDGHALPVWAAEFDCHSWAQFFLKFIVSHPAVTCAIPATGDPAHLIDNVQAGSGRLPNAATREKMAAYVRQL